MAKWRQVDQIEDGAARAILRRTRIGAASLLRRADQPASARVTFAMLRDCAEFPAQLVATDSPVDPVEKLLRRFAKSQLFSGWAKSWTDNVHVPVGRRRLVAAGIGWPYMVLGDGLPPERSHLCLKSPVGELHLQTLADWIETLEWSEVTEKNTDDE